MLMIRLQRIGRKHEPAYRLVLTDSKNSTKSGKFLEILGNYDSRRGEKAELKSERISHWISKGVKVSDTVHNLLVDKKIITGKKINKLPKKTAIKEEISQEKSISNEKNSEDVTIADEQPAELTEVADMSTEEATQPITEELSVEESATKDEVVA